ncbi:MAG: response regulator [Candidatus Altiarchaeota archaeon]|nr:response regulator [Candidatus Altiarchaeota archaeon]
MVKVLVVDDYAPLREIAVMILKSKGFDEVFEAESPEEGMRLFEEHKPELVILDIIMPVTNGIDLAAEIKKVNPETKVVMLSVLGENTHGKKRVEEVADLYLVKPLTHEKVDKIKEILDSGP